MTNTTDLDSGTAAKLTELGGEKANNESDSVNSQGSSQLISEVRELTRELSDDPVDVELRDKEPAKVFDRFENKWRRDGNAESAVQPYRSAWGQFCEWMEFENYQYLSDLERGFIADYDEEWVADKYEKSKLSRRSHLSRVKNVLQYAENRSWVDPRILPGEDGWDQIIPDIADEKKVRSNPLPPEKGERIMEWANNEKFGSRAHVLWILLFRYGLRVTAIRALDRCHLLFEEPDNWPDGEDFYPHLSLKDRPGLGQVDDPGLPLKNKREELAGRRIPLRKEHVPAFREYVRNGSSTGAKSSRKEHEVPDKYGLHGLLTGEQNARLSDRTIRERTHWLTCPTTYTSGECDCDGCVEYRDENGRNPYPSKRGKHCNETHSPHQVRHGAVTSLLDDYDHEKVSRVVGTSPETIRNVYDRADEYRRMNRLATGWVE